MNILDTVTKFQISEHIIGYSPLGNGHINTTYLIKTKGKNYYVLQRINNNAFKDVDKLMNNIYNTTAFLSSKGFETLKVVKTKDDNLYYQDDSGYYRLYSYIDDVICYEGVSDLDSVYSCAKAFGLLHKALRDYDASTLYEVIPNFHNTKDRYDAFIKAVESNPCDRVKDCRSEIESLKKHEKEYSLLVDSIANGDIRLAVTHNDPKINNVLFDRNTGDIRAVIDLDTIMPGSYLYDYGDALRSLFTGEYEDSKDLSKIGINYPLFEMYTKGYLSEMKGVLNDKEVNLLTFSVYLLTAELALRFLTDYLNGDVYFKVAYPEHNLVRARTQLKLANEIYDHLGILNEIVHKCYKNS